MIGRPGLRPTLPPTLLSPKPVVEVIRVPVRHSSPTSEQESAPRVSAAALKREGRIADINRAATEAIHRLGAKKVSVDDIARAAGLSRRTFYRLYDSRRELMEAISLDRLAVIAEQVKLVLKECHGFEESLVIGTIETGRIATSDEVYISLLQDDPTLVFEPKKPELQGSFMRLFLGIWAGVFEAARKEGVMRLDLTDEQISDWIMDLHRLLILQSDMTDNKKANMLRTFVLPSLAPRGAIDRNGDGASKSQKRGVSPV